MFTFFRKKDKGIVDHVLPFMIAVIFLLVTVVAFTYMVSWINTKSSIDLVCRRYMLKMEQDGYLTVGNLIALKDDIEGYNVEDLSTNGTTTTPVGYGEFVTLKVKGTLVTRGVNFGNIWGQVGDVRIPFEIVKVSTAKN